MNDMNQGKPEQDGTAAAAGAGGLLSHTVITAITVYVRSIRRDGRGQTAARYASIDHETLRPEWLLICDVQG